MKNNLEYLDNLLVLLETEIKHLEKYSLHNGDIFLEEVEVLKETVESIKDQTWKLEAN